MHPDLFIAIPRGFTSGEKLFSTASKYWELVRKHGGSRIAMVKFICGIGDYSDRHDRFAIEFNIKAYGARMDADTLWKHAMPEFMFMVENRDYSRERKIFDKMHAEYENRLWLWACEEAFEGWRDSDTPYETFTARRVDWEFEVRGRSGGHLVMKSAAGINLTTSAEELAEYLMEKDATNAYVNASHSQVRDLFIICVQNSVDLTSANINKEVEYRAAWRLWTSFVEPELDKPKPEVNGAVTQESYDLIVRQYGVDSVHAENFRNICQIANETLEA